MTELEMRETKVPWIKDKSELMEYIDALVSQDHDYGTCVYAMSMSAVAAFNYVAGTLGATGFQAGCADLDILRRTRHLDCPFIIIKAEDELYPQYNIEEKLREAREKWVPWCKEQAIKKLEEHEADSVHPNVWKHWEYLAASSPTQEVA